MLGRVKAYLIGHRELTVLDRLLYLIDNLGTNRSYMEHKLEGIFIMGQLEYLLGYSEGDYETVIEIIDLLDGFLWYSKTINTDSTGEVIGLTSLVYTGS